jgi:hypothetical protein
MTRLSIKVSRRLVSEDEAWMVSEGSTHGDPLHFPSRKLMWPMSTSMNKPHLFKQFSGSPTGVARGNPGQERGHDDILLCSEGGKQIKILEDVPEERPTISRKVPLVLKVYRLSRDNDPSTARGHHEPSY